MIIPSYHHYIVYRLSVLLCYDGHQHHHREDLHNLVNYQSIVIIFLFATSNLATLEKYKWTQWRAG